MKSMTHEEIKAMVGTEFNYIQDNGAGIKAVIAAFDPKVGLTCLATNFVDSAGVDHSRNIDKNGNICLMGFDRRDVSPGGRGFELLSFALRSIKNLGYFGYTSGKRVLPIKDGGNPTCSF